MDTRALREFMIELKQSSHARGQFLGLLHLLIGRRISKTDGSVITAGLSWRDLAAMLKKIRWHKESVGELGLDPRKLPPRQRERFWYTAIAMAHVDSAIAQQAGDRLAEKLRGLGYVIGAAPEPVKTAR